MEGLRIDVAYIGTYIKPAAIGIQETGKIGAWKTWHVSPNDSTKGGVNKGIRYTSTYAPGAYRNTTSER